MPFLSLWLLHSGPERSAPQSGCVLSTASACTRTNRRIGSSWANALSNRNWPGPRPSAPSACEKSQSTRCGGPGTQSGPTARFRACRMFWAQRRPKAAVACFVRENETVKCLLHLRSPFPSAQRPEVFTFSASFCGSATWAPGLESFHTRSPEFRKDKPPRGKQKEARAGGNLSLVGNDNSVHVAEHYPYRPDILVVLLRVSLKDLDREAIASLG